MAPPTPDGFAAAGSRDAWLPWASAAGPTFEEVWEKKRDSSSRAAQVLLHCLVRNAGLLAVPDGKVNNRAVAPLVFESAHGYEHCASSWFEVKVPGARMLQVSFDPRCATEEGCDKLFFLKTRDESLDDGIQTDYCFTGREGHSCWKDFEYEGESFWCYFCSDGSESDWGYRFTVTPVMASSQSRIPPLTVEAAGSNATVPAEEAIVHLLEKAPLEAVKEVFAVTCAHLGLPQPRPGTSDKGAVPVSASVNGSRLLKVMLTRAAQENDRAPWLVEAAAEALEQVGPTAMGDSLSRLEVVSAQVKQRLPVTLARTIAGLAMKETEEGYETVLAKPALAEELLVLFSGAALAQEKQRDCSVQDDTPYASLLVQVLADIISALSADGATPNTEGWRLVAAVSKSILDAAVELLEDKLHTISGTSPVLDVLTPALLRGLSLASPWAPEWLWHLLLPKLRVLIEAAKKGGADSLRAFTTSLQVSLGAALMRSAAAAATVQGEKALGDAMRCELIQNVPEAVLAASAGDEGPLPASPLEEAAAVFLGLAPKPTPPAESTGSLPEPFPEFLASESPRAKKSERSLRGMLLPGSLATARRHVFATLVIHYGLQARLQELMQETAPDSPPVQASKALQALWGQASNLVSTMRKQIQESEPSADSTRVTAIMMGRINFVMQSCLQPDASSCSIEDEDSEDEQAIQALQMRQAFSDDIKTEADHGLVPDGMSPSGRRWGSIRKRVNFSRAVSGLRMAVMPLKKIKAAEAVVQRSQQPPTGLKEILLQSLAATCQQVRKHSKAAAFAALALEVLSDAVESAQLSDEASVHASGAKAEALSALGRAWGLATDFSRQSSDVATAGRLREAQRHAATMLAKCASPGVAHAASRQAQDALRALALSCFCFGEWSQVELHIFEELARAAVSAALPWAPSVAAAVPCSPTKSAGLRVELDGKGIDSHDSSRTAVAAAAWLCTTAAAACGLSQRASLLRWCQELLSSCPQRALAPFGSAAVQDVQLRRLEYKGGHQLPTAFAPIGGLAPDMDYAPYDMWDFTLAGKDCQCISFNVLRYWPTSTREENMGRWILTQGPMSSGHYVFEVVVRKISKRMWIGFTTDTGQEGEFCFDNLTDGSGTCKVHLSADGAHNLYYSGDRFLGGRASTAAAPPCLAAGSEGAEWATFNDDDIVSFEVNRDPIRKCKVIFSLNGHVQGYCDFNTEDIYPCVIVEAKGDCVELRRRCLSRPQASVSELTRAEHEEKATSVPESLGGLSFCVDRPLIAWLISLGWALSSKLKNQEEEVNQQMRSMLVAILVHAKDYAGAVGPADVDLVVALTCSLLQRAGVPCEQEVECVLASMELDASGGAAWSLKARLLQHWLSCAPDAVLQPVVSRLEDVQGGAAHRAALEVISGPAGITCLCPVNVTDATSKMQTAGIVVAMRRHLIGVLVSASKEIFWCSPWSVWQQDSTRTIPEVIGQKVLRVCSETLSTSADADSWHRLRAVLAVLDDAKLANYVFDSGAFRKLQDACSSDVKRPKPIEDLCPLSMAQQLKLCARLRSRRDLLVSLQDSIAASGQSPEEVFASFALRPGLLVAKKRQDGGEDGEESSSAPRWGPPATLEEARLPGELFATLVREHAGWAYTGEIDELWDAIRADLEEGDDEANSVQITGQPPAQYSLEDESGEVYHECSVDECDQLEAALLSANCQLALSLAGHEHDVDLSAMCTRERSEGTSEGTNYRIVRDGAPQQVPAIGVELFKRLLSLELGEFNKLFNRSQGFDGLQDGETPKEDEQRDVEVQATAGQEAAEGDGEGEGEGEGQEPDSEEDRSSFVKFLSDLQAGKPISKKSKFSRAELLDVAAQLSTNSGSLKLAVYAGEAGASGEADETEKDRKTKEAEAEQKAITNLQALLLRLSTPVGMKELMTWECNHLARLACCKALSRAVSVKPGFLGVPETAAQLLRKMHVTGDTAALDAGLKHIVKSDAALRKGISESMLAELLVVLQELPDEESSEGDLESAFWLLGLVIESAVEADEDSCIGSPVISVLLALAQKLPDEANAVQVVSLLQKAFGQDSCTDKVKGLELWARVEGALSVGRVATTKGGWLSKFGQATASLCARITPALPRQVKVQLSVLELADASCQTLLDPEGSIALFLNSKAACSVLGEDAVVRAGKALQASLAVTAGVRVGVAPVKEGALVDITSAVVTECLRGEATVMCDFRGGPCKCIVQRPGEDKTDEIMPLDSSVSAWCFVAIASVHGTSAVAVPAQASGPQPMPIIEESSHPYENSLDQSKEVRVPGAKALKISFDENCSTESGYDVLSFYTDESLSVGFEGVSEMSGSKDCFCDFEIPGDSFWYHFRSDSSNTDWGFRFTVTPVMGTGNVAKGSASAAPVPADLARGQAVMAAFANPASCTQAGAWTSLGLSDLAVQEAFASWIRAQQREKQREQQAASSPPPTVPEELMKLWEELEDGQVIVYGAGNTTCNGKFAKLSDDGDPEQIYMSTSETGAVVAKDKDTDRWVICAEYDLEKWVYESTSGVAGPWRARDGENEPAPKTYDRTTPPSAPETDDKQDEFEDSNEKSSLEDLLIARSGKTVEVPMEMPEPVNLSLPGASQMSLRLERVIDRQILVKTPGSSFAAMEPGQVLEIPGGSCTLVAGPPTGTKPLAWHIPRSSSQDEKEIALLDEVVSNKLGLISRGAMLAVASNTDATLAPRGVRSKRNLFHCFAYEEGEEEESETEQFYISPKLELVQLGGDLEVGISHAPFGEVVCKFSSDKKWAAGDVLQVVAAAGAEGKMRGVKLLQNGAVFSTWSPAEPVDKMSEDDYQQKAITNLKVCIINGEVVDIWYTYATDAMRLDYTRAMPWREEEEHEFDKLEEFHIPCGDFLTEIRFEDSGSGEGVLPALQFATASGIESPIFGKGVLDESSSLFTRSTASGGHHINKLDYTKSDDAPSQLVIECEPAAPPGPEDLCIQVTCGSAGGNSLLRLLPILPGEKAAHASDADEKDDQVPHHVASTAWNAALQWTAPYPPEQTFDQLRFTTKKTRRKEEDCVQLSMLEFMCNGEAVSLSDGCYASQDNGNNPYGEGPDQAIDSNPDTKWLDFNKKPLIVTWPSPITVDSFRFTTGNDFPNRDPVQWVVEGRNRESESESRWVLLHQQTKSYNPPSDRNSATEWFSFCTDAPGGQLLRRGDASSTLRVQAWASGQDDRQRAISELGSDGEAKLADFWNAGIEGWSPAQDVKLVAFVNDLAEKIQCTAEEAQKMLVRGPVASGPTSSDAWALTERTPQEAHARFLFLQCLNQVIEKSVLPFTNSDDIRATSHGRQLCSLKSLLFDSVVGAKVKSVGTFTGREPLNLNRHLSIACKDAKRCDVDGQQMLFAQAAAAKLQATCFMSSEQNWEQQPFCVAYVGEDGIDQGGLYRDFFDAVGSELMSEYLPILVPSANQLTNSGEDRDCWVLNPDLQVEAESPGANMLRFLGRLMGTCLLRGDILPLHLSEATWKGLADEDLGIEDLEAFDVSAARAVEMLRDLAAAGIDRDSFDSSLGDMRFTYEDSAQRQLPLLPGGETRAVTFDDAPYYAELLLRHRLNESKAQMAILKAGLLDVVEAKSIAFWSWDTFEKRVVGVADIDVAVLKRHTTYEGFDSEEAEEAEVVVRFWNVLEKFEQKDLQCFIRFVWGRSRLPPEGSGQWGNGFKIAHSGADTNSLPLAHTCFFQLDLPEYPTEEMMKDKLGFAIRNCLSMGNA
eukprot:TRINITY_DN20995_c0_g1_i4.p1 TRINITY_DN20995_c0_g1~~TRINITY_DN20995_c0_g1_i4.p1  ORF type:complete len:4051 (+),score=916.23 TRINITY_DN20995_c0_g1_i4:977-12154(+)